MGLQESLTTGDTVRQVDRTPMDVEPGTLMHKAIPPRMVEPYLTGRRSIIAGSCTGSLTARSPIPETSTAR